VVLTDERKKHITQRRGSDSALVLDNIVNTIRDYSFIIDAGNDCVKYIKLGKNDFSYVVKLSLKKQKEGNSVISGMKVNTKKINKYLKKNKIIDSKL